MVRIPINVCSMVLVLDGNPEIDTHLWSDLGYLICLRHLFGWEEVTNGGSYSRRDLFSFTRAHLLPARVINLYTVCPGSSDPFHIVCYYIKWFTTPGHLVSSRFGSGSGTRTCFLLLYPDPWTKARYLNQVLTCERFRGNFLRRGYFEF